METHSYLKEVNNCFLSILNSSSFLVAMLRTNLNQRFILNFSVLYVNPNKFFIDAFVLNIKL